MKRFLMSVAALALAACASTDQPKTAETVAATGLVQSGEASPVGVIPTTLLHDAQRNKDLDISIEYPTKSGPFPVVIFSPGYSGSNRGYESMVSYWTSRGYVVIRPSHADAGALREAPRDPAAERRDDRQQSRRQRSNDQQQAQQAPPPFRPNPAEAIWEKEREPQWRDRVLDIKLILDSLDSLEQRFPELKGKLDHDKIGVGGHAYGAFTAMLAAGVRASGNPPLQFGDPRIKAVLALSPPGIAANRGLTAESFRDLKVPALFMAGSRDFGAVETETPQWRRAAYEDSPAGDKYFLLIEGARYATFAGLSGPINPEEDMMVYEPRIDPVTGQQVMTRVPRTSGSFISDRGLFDRIRNIGLTFWDSYLKNDAKAKERLTGGQFGGNVQFEKR